MKFTLILLFLQGKTVSLKKVILEIRGRLKMIAKLLVYLYANNKNEVVLFFLSLCCLCQLTVCFSV